MNDDARSDEPLVEVVLRVRVVEREELAEVEPYTMVRLYTAEQVQELDKPVLRAGVVPDSVLAPAPDWV